MDALLKDKLLTSLRILCGSCVRAPQNRNRSPALPACTDCQLKHDAADVHEALLNALRPSAEGLTFPQVLRWYACRLVDVYKENPFVDFVHLLRNRADEIEKAMGLPSVDETTEDVTDACNVA